ncbi:SIR2 family protein [Acinetobacter sp. 'aerobic (ED)']|uniref:SIR2 family protein n=1 Tax=Acinetobacter sp. 'aerobic (ED)' TaxID=174230 RepID=UPI00192C8A9F|nr:SIR2 family protein [Acinetobacter sp. 'aerobic (ED)']
MNYEQALSCAKNGKAILFLGSGFSFGLKSIVGNTLPTASGLANILCDKASISKTDDLKRACKKYLLKKSADELVELLKDHFLVNRTSEDHETIASIPWLRVYTTNYDNAFEVSAAKNSLRYQSLDADKSPRGEITKQNVIHINGYIETLDQTKLNTSFKLTSTSYLTQQFRESAWCNVFRNDIQTAQAIFFIGYSMYDIDIQEIMFEDESVKNKTFFIDKVDLTETEIDDMDIVDFGTVKPIGIKSFANDLNITESIKLKIDEVPLNNFQELTFHNKDNIPIRHDDVSDLMSFGNLNEILLSNDILSNNRNNYIIKRHEEDQCINDLKNNKNLILYSELANGKSVLSKILCYRLIIDGYNVFTLNDVHSNAIAFYEIEKIIKQYDKCLFLIENYTNNLEIVNHINMARKSTTKLLLISRTIEHERYIDDILFNKKILNTSETYEVEIDKLSEQDVSKFIEYYDRYGLWGSRHALSKKSKENYINEKAKREISGLLLGILESPQVAKKLDTIFDEMKASESVLKNILAILCLNITNIQNPTNYLISTLSGENNISSSIFRSSPAFSHLIYKTEYGYLFPKSSIMAQYILNNFPDSNLIVKYLIELCKNVRSNSFESNDLYMQIYKDLASFRYAQKILPNKGKRESLINFYEGLREIPQERNNPHFWLQYAIARLSHPDSNNLKYAQSHLDTALSLANRIDGYWTDDIETQYSRYHIEYAINLETQEHDLAFESFKRSYELILKIQKGNKRKSEVLRPISRYEAFYNKFSKTMTNEQLKYLENACENLEQIIYKFVDANKLHFTRYDRALKNVKNILASLKIRQHIKENA